MSRQLDLAIYDAVFSMVLPLGIPDVFLFPCESVYGSIEVKSRLDTGGLSGAIENIASLKELRREPTDMWDITPLVRNQIKSGFGTTVTGDTSVRNPYLGCVFAWDGLTSDTVRKRLQESSVDRALLPDLFVNVEQQYVIARWCESDEGRRLFEACCFTGGDLCGVCGHPVRGRHVATFRVAAQHPSVPHPPPATEPIRALDPNVAKLSLGERPL